MSRIKGKNTKPEMLVRKFLYANEAFMLNVALFGKLSKQWRNENPRAEGNIRDTSTIGQLVVLSNMESTNAVFTLQHSQIIGSISILLPIYSFVIIFVI